MSLVSHSEERSVASHQRKTTIGGGRGSTVGGGVPRKQTVSEERRQSNHWEANRQQEEESDLVSVTSCGEELFCFSSRLQLKISKNPKSGIFTIFKQHSHEVFFILCNNLLTFTKSLCASQILAGLSDEQEPVASDMDWLDNLSESGGSNISKIDWAAIERMVATGES